jgi:hypothetical protein
MFDENVFQSVATFLFAFAPAHRYLLAELVEVLLEGDVRQHLPLVAVGAATGGGGGGGIEEALLSVVVQLTAAGQIENVYFEGK